MLMKYWPYPLFRMICIQNIILKRDTSLKKEVLRVPACQYQIRHCAWFHRGGYRVGRSYGSRLLLTPPPPPTSHPPLTSTRLR